MFSHISANWMPSGSCKCASGDKWRKPGSANVHFATDGGARVPVIVQNGTDGGHRVPANVHRATDSGGRVPAIGHFATDEAVAFLYCIVGRLPVIIGIMSDNIPQAPSAVAQTSQSIPPQFASNPVKLLGGHRRSGALGGAARTGRRRVVVRSGIGGPAPQKFQPGVEALALVARGGRGGGGGGAGRGRAQIQPAVPAAFLRKDANGKPEIDYGVCVLRFP